MLILICFTCSSLSVNAMVPKERIVELMKKNNIKKFVRTAGSEEKAIEELISFTLPDTIYNSEKELIWRSTRSGKIAEMDYYASRKIQAYYWILMIYYSNYRNIRSDQSCLFLDDYGRAIWDYQDLDEEKKEYYYKVIVPSPTDHKDYFDDLGYIRIQSEQIKRLEFAFREWHHQMKIQGLTHMRAHKAAPIDSTKYRIE